MKSKRSEISDLSEKEFRNVVALKGKSDNRPRAVIIDFMPTIDTVLTVEINENDNHY